jgi:hypothetical protein
MTDFDSPWKEAIEIYLRGFVAFFYPIIHNDIDWQRGYEFLDKELQKSRPRSATGRRYVDKLVKVYRTNGRPLWILIHIEVQTQRESGFLRRMYRYNTRIEDHFDHTAISLIVQADDDPSWRPSRYEKSLWGWSSRMTFPTAKLLDYVGREAELEADKNPFAKIVLAHLKALETRRDPATRRQWKFRLVRGLYEQGFDAEEVRQLFRLIDWLMELPPRLEEMFWNEIKTYEEEQKMPFITTPERIGIKKYVLPVMERLLEARFGEEGKKLMPEIAALNDPAKYLAIGDTVGTATTLEEVRAACAKLAAPASTPKKGKSGKKK